VCVVRVNVMGWWGDCGGKIQTKFGAQGGSIPTNLEWLLEVIFRLISTVRFGEMVQ
jgi:hypothetical protein